MAESEQERIERLSKQVLKGRPEGEQAMAVRLRPDSEGDVKDRLQGFRDGQWEDVDVDIVSDEEMARLNREAALPGWTPTDPPPGLERFSPEIQKATSGMQWMRTDEPDPIAPEEGFYPNWAKKIAEAVADLKPTSGERPTILPVRSARTIGNWLHSDHDTGVPTYTSVDQAIEGLVAEGLAEYAGIDEHGEQQYVLTSEGTALADRLIQGEAIVGTVVLDHLVHEPDGNHRLIGMA